MILVEAVNRRTQTIQPVLPRNRIYWNNPGTLRDTDPKYDAPTYPAEAYLNHWPIMGKNIHKAIPNETVSL